MRGKEGTWSWFCWSRGNLAGLASIPPLRVPPHILIKLMTADQATSVHRDYIQPCNEHRWVCRGSAKPREMFSGVNTTKATESAAAAVSSEAEPFQTSSDHDVVSTLHFYKPPRDGAAPFFEVKQPTGAGDKNYSHDPHEVRIRDVRPYLRQFTLDSHSFQTLTNVDPIPARTNASGIDGAADGTKKILGAIIGDCQEVVIFDETIRQADLGEVLLRPVRKVHIDQSKKGAWLRAKQLLSPSTHSLVSEGKLRFRIINLWRPLGDVVLDHPLAFADSNTIPDQDLVQVDHLSLTARARPWR